MKALISFRNLESKSFVTQKNCLQFNCPLKMNRPKFYIYLPIVFALVLILGIFIGSTFNLRTTPGTISVDGNGAYSKIDQILKYVEEQYVDTIKTKDLVDKTIVSLLANLDPHSSYITAEELIASNDLC